MTKNKDLESAYHTIDKEIEALNMMRSELDDSLIKALDLMQSTKGRVIVTGMGKSGHIGSKIAATLASTGTPSFFVHPAEASHGDLGMLTADDTVLAISNSGESKELSDILIYCKRYGIPLISVTKNPDSTLGKAGDIILKLPNDGEACPLGLAPTSSTTATLVLGDVLAIALLERKGFSVNDYKQRHPGGKLGAILQKVSDLMHVGDELPLAGEDANMRQIIMTMSSKMLGCVGIVDKEGNLTGMITDGDLRRAMVKSADNELFSKKALDIMTKNPKVTTAGILVAEVVNFMNSKSITQLFVVENKKPIGVIHLHDCLRAGFTFDEKKASSGNNVSKAA
ncbi:MAG: KpsF/GutQ family sugar-phosphate isomerase [Alphaproteobacteria bacterium]|nr:KpsF/GutQ family sugar-phosphate isomerase [Alphaproteobacteria bacterium]